MTETAWWWHFLGLKPDASKVEIKSAYHRLAKLLHRDHGGTDEDMQRLNEAYHLALADNGPAAQDPPRHEPPPKSAPREPFFTSASHRVGRVLVQVWNSTFCWIFIVLIAWTVVAALLSDPKTPALTWPR
jgi:hypothetical protein